MIVKILLTMGLLLPLAFIFLQAKPVRFLRLASLLTIGVGILLVWNPDVSTRVAQFIGVGRGTDLILYTWIVASFAMILVLVVNQRRINANITRLTRELAIQEALHASEQSVADD